MTRPPWSRRCRRGVQSGFAATIALRSATCFPSAKPVRPCSSSRSGRAVFRLYADGVGGTVEDVGAVDGGPALNGGENFGFAARVQAEYLWSLDDARPAPYAALLVHQHSEAAGRIHASGNPAQLRAQLVECIRGGPVAGLDQLFGLIEREHGNVLHAWLNQHQWWAFPVAKLGLDLGLHDDLETAAVSCGKALGLE